METAAETVLRVCCANLDMTYPSRYAATGASRGLKATVRFERRTELDEQPRLDSG